jgi:Heterokaryon incompatibility protein (HET)
MGKVCQEARRVIVWLGEDSCTGESVIRVLRSTRDQKVSELLQDGERGELRGIHDFLNRTWFHRRWHLQRVC